MSINLKNKFFSSGTENTTSQRFDINSSIIPSVKRNKNKLLFLLLITSVISLVTFFVLPDSSDFGILENEKEENFQKLTEEEKRLVENIVSMKPEVNKFDREEVSKLFLEKKYEVLLANLKIACENSASDDEIYHVQGGFRQLYKYLQQSDKTLSEMIKSEQEFILFKSSTGFTYANAKYNNKCIIQRFE